MVVQKPNISKDIIDKKVLVSKPCFIETASCRLINDKLLTQVFSCEFCKIFKNTNFKNNFCQWLLTNLFYQNKPLAPEG